MNSERYNDPTAEIAVARVMKENRKKRRVEKEKTHEFPSYSFKNLGVRHGKE